MRKMLFLLLLSPLLSTAQQDEYDLAYWKNRPDSLTRPFHLPERDYSPTFRYDSAMSYHQKTRVFIVTTDAVYRKLFWRYIYTNDSLAKYKNSGTDPWWYNWVERHHVDSLPVIDFSKKELVLYAACAQCLAYCHHGQGNESCHRNACMFRESWFIREKRSHQ